MMIIIADINKLPVAESVYPYALYLIGPYLEAIHNNDLTSFYDEMAQYPYPSQHEDMDTINYWDKINRTHITYDVHCTICDEAVTIMEKEILDVYNSYQVKETLSQFYIANVTRIDQSTVKLHLQEKQVL